MEPLLNFFSPACIQLELFHCLELKHHISVCHTASRMLCPFQKWSFFWRVNHVVNGFVTSEFIKIYGIILWRVPYLRIIFCPVTFRRVLLLHFLLIVLAYSCSLYYKVGINFNQIVARRFQSGIFEAELLRNSFCPCDSPVE